jgi:hypothetical protein
MSKKKGPEYNFRTTHSVLSEKIAKDTIGKTDPNLLIPILIRNLRSTHEWLDSRHGKSEDPNLLFVHGKKIKHTDYPETIKYLDLVGTRTKLTSLAEKRDAQEKYSDISWKLINSNPIFMPVFLLRYDSDELRASIFSFIDKLLHLGLNINLRSIDGWTALNFAIRVGRFEYAKYLISKGADVTISTEFTKTTPLHNIVYSSPSEEKDKVTKLLISKGADPLAKTIKGDSVVKLVFGDYSRKLDEKGGSYDEDHTEFYEMILSLSKTKGFSFLEKFYEELIREKLSSEDAPFLRTPTYQIVKIISKKETESKKLTHLSIEDIQNAIDKIVKIIKGDLWLTSEKELSFFESVLVEVEDETYKILGYTLSQIRYALSTSLELERVIDSDIEKIYHELNKLKQGDSDSKDKITVLCSKIPRKFDSCKAHALILSEEEKKEFPVMILQKINPLTGVTEEIVSDPTTSIKPIRSIDGIIERLRLLNIKLGFHKMKKLDIPELSSDDASVMTVSFDSAPDLHLRKEITILDLTPELLRILADNYLHNKESGMLSEIYKILDYSDEMLSSDEEISNLNRIILKIKGDINPHSDSIRYAKYRLPAKLILKFLSLSPEAVYKSILDTPDHPLDHSLVSEVVGGVKLEPKAVELKPEITKESKSTLEKLNSGNFMKITVAELIKLCSDIGLQIEVKSGLQLKITCFNNSVIGGHIIHSKDIGARGEIDIKTLQLLRNHFNECNIFDFYLSDSLAEIDDKADPVEEEHSEGRAGGGGRISHPDDLPPMGSASIVDPDDYF